MYEMHAIVKGDVQGVFFRRTVKEHATQLKLNGYARNLENGDVEICAQGSKQDLEKLLEQIKAEPGRGRIDALSASFKEPTETFHSFKIF